MSQQQQQQAAGALTIDAIKTEGFLARKLAEKCSIIEAMIDALNQARARIQELEAAQTAAKAEQKEPKE
jgi:hypothetical protein